LESLLEMVPRSLKMAVMDMQDASGVRKVTELVADHGRNAVVRFSDRSERDLNLHVDVAQAVEALKNYGELPFMTVRWHQRQRRLLVAGDKFCDGRTHHLPTGVTRSRLK
jgi:hypothetical protein